MELERQMERQRQIEYQRDEERRKALEQREVSNWNNNKCHIPLIMGLRLYCLWA